MGERDVPPVHLRHFRNKRTLGRPDAEEDGDEHERDTAEGKVEVLSSVLVSNGIVSWAGRSQKSHLHELPLFASAPPYKDTKRVIGPVRCVWSATRTMVGPIADANDHKRPNIP